MALQSASDEGYSIVVALLST